PLVRWLRSGGRMRSGAGLLARADRANAAKKEIQLMSAPSTSAPASEPATATEAAEAAVEAIASAAGQEASFSLQLSQDQKDVREWVHGFAADVVRPAAHEWDEKEQTPWPIIEEAAKIGLYGYEGMAQFFADPT